jgi:hypothetical protein
MAPGLSEFELRESIGNTTIDVRELDIADLSSVRRFVARWDTTAAEVLEGVNLTRKTMIVTGGASGIGIETVRALSRAGAAVTIAARRPDAAETVAAVENPNFVLIRVILTSLFSVLRKDSGAVLYGVAVEYGT